MKISVKMALGGLLCLVITSPVHAMENDAQAISLCTLPVLVLEEIASALGSRRGENCDSSKATLEWKDITAAQAASRDLHKHFHAPNKDIIIISGKRDWREPKTGKAFLNCILSRLDKVKLYPHENKIVLDLSYSLLPAEGDAEELDRFLAKIDPSLAQRISKLDLAGNGLSELPDSVLRFENLTSLNLTENILSDDAVAKACSITSLRSLSLAYNRLQHLPDSMRAMTKLESLDLGGNEIPAKEFAPLENLKQSFKDLIINHNNLHVIPDAILKLENLEKLSIGHNPISLEELSKLKKLQKITAINLAGTTDHVPDVIFSFPHLTELDISHNRNIELSELRRVFAIKTLQRLILSYMNLAIIPDEIATLPRLIGLSVAGNPLPLSELEKICQLQNLTSLDISGMGLLVIPESIRNLRGLKWLNVTDSCFDKNTARIIRSWLPKDCDFFIEFSDLNE